MSTTAQLFDVPGPRGRATQRLAALVLGVFALGLGAAVLYKLGERGNLTAAKWAPLVSGEVWSVYLLPGIVNTL